MHIPDGYLSPQTCVVFYALMAPVWTAASRIVQRTLKSRQAPFLAMAAAFSFVIMMFNVPIPGGSTGHAIGSVLIAVLLGPWAACLVMTVVLLIQALLFGDGGITTLGAECFNMAFAFPFAGYYTYRLISAGAVRLSKRRLFAAGCGAYVGVNCAALLTAVELGLQPGYCPYGLNITVPVMAGGHLLVIGWLEAAVTVLALNYLKPNEQ